MKTNHTEVLLNFKKAWLDTNLISYLDQSSKIILAFSGGLDSSVLIDSFLYFMEKQDIKNYKDKILLCHVNHNLSKFADSWVKHCKAQADKWGVSLVIENIKDTNFNGDGLELWARKARYNIFNNHIEAADILLTGHHMDDQAETFLLQCLRGAGVSGMRAMPKVKAFGDGFLLRPLLDLSKEDFKNWATFRKLSWIEDDSNTDIKLDRNFIRHEILPKLEQRWPKAKLKFARASNFCQQAMRVIDQNIDLDKNCSLNIKKIIEQENNDQIVFIIRKWLDSNNIMMPSENSLLEFISQVNSLILSNKLDKSCELEVKNKDIKPQLFRIKLFNGRLYLVSGNVFEDQKAACKFEAIVDFNKEDNFLLPEYVYLDKPSNNTDCLIKYQPAEKLIACDASIDFVKSYEISKKHLESLGLKLDFEQWQKVIIRFRRGGEIVKWQDKHKSLKKIFNEKKVIPWQRALVPLVIVDDEVKWIIGL
jgi:tRNA(Ile)-lysidine synthase